MTRWVRSEDLIEKVPRTVPDTALHLPETHSPRDLSIPHWVSTPASCSFSCLLICLWLLLWFTSLFCLDDSQNLTCSSLSCVLQSHISKSWAMNHCYCNSRMLKLSSSLPSPSCAHFSSHHSPFSPPSPLLSPTSVVGPNPPTLPGLKHYHHLDYCPFPLLKSLPSPVSCSSETYLALVLLSLLLTDPSSARWPAWLAAWAAVILSSLVVPPPDSRLLLNPGFKVVSTLPS